MKKEDILKETNRCLNCSNPMCKNACPLGNDIPKFIQYVKENEIKLAYGTLLKTSVMPEVCSNICTKYCEKNCVLGVKGESIKIRDIEKYICDNAENTKDYSEKNVKSNKYRIAIVGSGPAGISCAYYLRKDGYNVTIFEKESVTGGILKNEIPDYRLEKSIIDNLVNKLIGMGVDIKYNIKLGKDIRLEELSNKYDAVFISIGAEKPNVLNIEGEDLENIYYSKDFLKLVNKEEITSYDIKDKIVCVIGGGNAALDCATVVKKLGASQSKIIYRRTENEMRVSEDEYDLAIENGVEFEYLALPVKFIGKDKIEEIRCVKMKLGDMDETGRASPIIVEDSNYSVKADIVVISLGCAIEEDLINDININKETKVIYINKYNQTNISNVFTGGDCASRQRTIAYASHMGIESAKNIIEFLENKLTME